MDCNSSGDQPAHRRCRSDAVGLLAADALLMPEVQEVQQAPGHARSVSLGSSASQFLQSLKLQDPASLQHSLQQASGDQLAFPDQHIPEQAPTGPGQSLSVAAAGPAVHLGQGGGAALQDSSAGQPARSKRSHTGGNGRVSKDSALFDADAAQEQQQQGFARLPAVVEDGRLDSERDWDSESDREGVGPNRRGSRNGSRRGGYNGRSESELLLLDPKRVKRILANRQSAARSKERRLNYTMELESKLHSLSVDSDKLHSQLSNLDKQDDRLKATKAELQHQVLTMQQQLSQVASDNRSLMATIFQLQASLGQPQVLPDFVMPPDSHGASAAQYQHSWQQYQQQDTGSKSAAGTKQRKQRQRKAKQEQPPDAGYAYHGGSYGSCAETDLIDPAAAAAAPVAELPVPPRPLRSASTAAAVGAAAAAAAGGGVLQAGFAAAGPGHGFTGNTEPPSVSPLQPPVKQEHQWHTGLGGSITHTQQQPAGGLQGNVGTVTAAATAAAAAGPAVDPYSAAAGAAGAAAATGHQAGVARASGAADAAGSLLLHQLPAPGADAVMGDAEDDIAMLGAFLEGDEGTDDAAAGAALTAAASSPAAAAAAAAVPPCGPGAGHFGPGSAGTSPLGGQTAASAAGGGGGGAGLSTPAHVMGWSPVTTGLGPHSSPAAAAAAAAAATPAAAAGFTFRSSPALSDPVGVECWLDDISSGSMGGSVTRSHTPNLTPSARPTANGPHGIAGSGACIQQGPWQHQQQPRGTAAAAAGASRGAVVSSPAAAGAAGVGSGSGGGGYAGWGSGPPSGAGSMTSPITPVSVRVVTPLAASARGVAAVTGLSMPAAAATPGCQGYGPQQQQEHHYQHHQQQQQFGQGLMQVQQQVNFVMGANPAAQHWSGSRHVRSASTGCVSGLSRQGFEQFTLPADPQHRQQQQQQTMATVMSHARQQQGMHLHDGSYMAGGVASAAVASTSFSTVSRQVSIPEVSIPGGTALQAFGASALEVHSVAGQFHGQVARQHHRRSHSHAAAFLTQGMAGFHEQPVGLQQHQQQQQQQGYSSVQQGLPVQPRLQ